MAGTSPAGLKPGVHTSLAAAIDFVLGKHAQDTENCLPAIVVDYDAEKNIATLQPAIMITAVDSTGQVVKVSREQLLEVPVLSLGAGGFHIHFPIAKGDLGWIHAADRDIGLFLQELAEAEAVTIRTHNFNDSLFVPDVFRKYKLQSEDAGAMVIQSVDGATRISVRPDNIKVTAPVGVVIDTPKTHITGDVLIDKTLTVTEATTLSATLDVTGATTMKSTAQITGATTVGGPLAANGGFTAAGGQAASLPAGTTVAGKALDTHTHISGNKGETTGPMQ